MGLIELVDQLTPSYLDQLTPQRPYCKNVKFCDISRIQVKCYIDISYLYVFDCLTLEQDVQNPYCFRNINANIIISEFY